MKKENTATGFGNAFEILEIIKPILIDTFKVQLEEFKTQLLNQVRAVAGQMVQSALDDVYKDMGNVTDKLTTRVNSIRKQTNLNKEKLAAVE